MLVLNPMIKGIGLFIDFLASYDKNIPIGTILENLRPEGKEIEPLSG
jgi:p-aminobenzoyl-glutamate transporter AbgT